MKHSEQRQAGAEYDQEKDDRLVKASYDFNLQFAAKFTAPSVANNGGGSSGSSSAHASAPAAAGSTAARPAVAARPVRAAAVKATAAALAMSAVASARAVMAVSTGNSGPIVALPVAAPPVTASAAAASSTPTAASPDPEPAARACNFLACTLDRTESLRECACGAGPHHHICSINAGCEELSSLCAVCLKAPIYRAGTVGNRDTNDANDANDAAAAIGGDGDGDVEGGRGGDGGVDDEWLQVPGGPWVARLCKRSSQPPSQASYRRYYVAIRFNPADTPLVPGGLIKFPIVAGAPSDGITCTLPASWSGSTKEMVFTLRLSKDGATENSVTINSAFCKEKESLVEESEEEQEESGGGGGDGGDGGDGGGMNGGGGRSAEEDSMAAAIQASIRSTHLETNILPQPIADSTLPPLAAMAREVMCLSTTPLPGEGEALMELSSGAAAAAALMPSETSLQRSKAASPVPSSPASAAPSAPDRPSRAAKRAEPPGEGDDAVNAATDVGASSTKKAKLVDEGQRRGRRRGRL